MTAPTATIRILGREVTIVRAIAASVCVVAGVVVLGWVASIDALTRVAPDLPPMMPLTAALVGLSAVALERCASVPRSRLGRGAAWLVALGSALVVLAYVSGIPAGVQRGLAPLMPAGAGAQVPGLPAPNSALAMLLIGFAIIGMDSAPVLGVYPAEVAAGTAGIIATTALLGQAYGARYLYGISAYTGMSMPSAVCVLGLAIGAFAARPQRGLAAALRSDRLGATAAARLIPLVLAAPIVFGWLASTGDRAGYFDAPLGSALQTVATALVTIFAIARTAKLVDRLDGERQRMNVERETAVAHAAGEARFRSIFENAAVALVEHDGTALATRVSELQARFDNQSAAALAADREFVEWMLEAVPPVDANLAALALFGAPSKQALGASWREALLPETVAVFIRGIGAVAAGHSRFEAEVPIRTLSGAHRDLMVSLALPHPPAFGRMVASFVDVTELKRAQQMVLDARRAHEAAALAATEAERRRVARELHDGVLQELAALKLTLEVEYKHQAREAVALALRRTTAMIEEVRAVVDDLHPAELVTGLLHEAIAAHAQLLTAGRSIALVCELQSGVRLQDWAAREVYRVAQEAIGNAVRHAAPRRLAVRLWQQAEETGLEVEDDGVGFDPQALRRGTGLANLHERATILSADLAVQSHPGSGTRVRLLVRTAAWLPSRPGAETVLNPG